VPAMSCGLAQRPSTSDELPTAFGGPHWAGIPETGPTYRDEHGRVRTLTTYEADDGFPDVGFGRRPFSGRGDTCNTAPLLI
jgi:hypothetical protein